MGDGNEEDNRDELKHINTKLCSDIHGSFNQCFGSMAAAPNWRFSCSLGGQNYYKNKSKARVLLPLGSSDIKEGKEFIHKTATT